MEAYPRVVTNPTSMAVRPVMFTDHPPRKPTSFLVDDIVRDPLDSFNSPCYARCIPDPTYPESTQAQAKEDSKNQGWYFRTVSDNWS